MRDGGGDVREAVDHVLHALWRGGEREAVKRGTAGREAEGREHSTAPVLRHGVDVVAQLLRRGGDLVRREGAICGPHEQLEEHLQEERQVSEEGPCCTASPRRVAGRGG